MSLYFDEQRIADADWYFDEQNADAGPSITFEHDIDAGSIDPASVVITGASSSTPAIEAKPRLTSSVHANAWVHWHFRIDTANGKQPTFTINVEDRWFDTQGYAASWRPTYTYDFVTWYQASSFTSLTSPKRVQFTFDAAFDQDTVYIADHPVWRQIDGVNLAAELAADGSGLVHVSAAADVNGVIGTSPAENDELGRAVGTRDIYGFRIEDEGQAPADGSRKRILSMECGLHSGEIVDGFHLRGFIDWVLTDASVRAQTFRRNWRVLLYFNLTPNGRYGGNWRGNFRVGTDPNRDYRDDLFALEESIMLRDALGTDINYTTGGDWDVHLQWHSAVSRDTSLNFDYADNSDATLRDALKTSIDSIDAEALDLVISTIDSTVAYWANSKGCRLAGFVEPGTRINPGLGRYKEIGAHYAEALQIMDDSSLFVSGVSINADPLTALTALSANPVISVLKSADPIVVSSALLADAYVSVSVTADALSAETALFGEVQAAGGVQVSALPLTLTSALSGQAITGVNVVAVPLSLIASLSASAVIGVNQSAPPLTLTASLFGNAIAGAVTINTDAAETLHLAAENPTLNLAAEAPTINLTP